jgi:aldose 1-epimerase
VAFQVTWQDHDNSLGLDRRVAVLADANNRLEVWPALGLNAYRWQAAGQELLYCPAQFFAENRPTRGGWPILFPFPNRIRDGKFDWQGKTYQLPLNDSTLKNAIHGFAVKRAWRIIDQGADAGSAWITGEFQCSVDAPETLALWPADYRLRVTFRLHDRILRVEAQADNPDSKPLPFGLGFHPYFAIAPFAGPQAIVNVGAAKIWELADNLPTGHLVDVDPHRDLRHGQSYADLQLDDVMSDLQPIAVDAQERLNLAGSIQHPGGDRLLTLWAGPDFREMVLFTPPHREAMCIEPYTCTTDAINLSQRGIDAGLRVLQPAERWQGVVEVHLTS